LSTYRLKLEWWVRVTRGILDRLLVVVVQGILVVHFMMLGVARNITIGWAAINFWGSTSLDGPETGARPSFIAFKMSVVFQSAYFIFSSTSDARVPNCFKTSMRIYAVLNATAVCFVALPYRATLSLIFGMSGDYSAVDVICLLEDLQSEIFEVMLRVFGSRVLLNVLILFKPRHPLLQLGHLLRAFIWDLDRLPHCMHATIVRNERIDFIQRDGLFDIFVQRLQPRS